MIAIYAKKNDRKAVDGYHALRSHSVPCALIGPEYGNVSLVHKVPFLFVGDGCDTIVSGFSSPIPESKILRSYDLLQPDYLFERLRNVYGLEFYGMCSGGIRFDKESVFFFGNRIALSVCEKLILRHLALCRGICFTAEEIAALCLDGGDGASVAVHVHNINAKNQASVTERVIYSKRYHGYFVK